MCEFMPLVRAGGFVTCYDDISGAEQIPAYHHQLPGSTGVLCFPPELFSICYNS